MRKISFAITMVAVLATSLCSFGTTPPIPGMTSGAGDHGMKHVMVALDDRTGTLSTHLGAGPATPLTMMSGHGMDYTPGKFDVLEEVYFNAQFGWLPDGFISVPPDASAWMMRTAASQPAGSTLRVYEAGRGTEMASWTMSEIYSSDGFRWQWDGIMQHDYYTADMLGSYSMSFDVYIGDSTGNPIAGYTTANTTLEFVVVPEPSILRLAILSIGIAGAVDSRRRQRTRCYRVPASHGGVTLVVTQIST